MTLGEFLAMVGCKWVTMVRIDVARPATDDVPIYVEVTSLCQGDDGKPYLDTETGEPAREVRRFRVKSLSLVGA